MTVHAKGYQSPTFRPAGGLTRPGWHHLRRRIPAMVAIVATMLFVGVLAVIILFPQNVVWWVDQFGLVERERVEARYDNLLVGACTFYCTAMIVLAVEWFVNRRGASVLWFAPSLFEPVPTRWFTRACVAATIGCALTIPIYILRFRLELDWLYVEDGPLEYATAIAFAFAAAIAVSSFMTASGRDVPSLLRPGLVAMAFASMFVAMEEISWGQRIVGLETPAWLSVVNTQNETNVHNIFTDHFNSSYLIIGMTLIVGHAATIVLRYRRTDIAIFAYAPHVFLMPISALIAAFSFHLDLNELIEPLAAAFVVLYSLQLRHQVRDIDPRT